MTSPDSEPEHNASEYVVALSIALGLVSASFLVAFVPAQSPHLTSLERLAWAWAVGAATINWVLPWAKKAVYTPGES